MKHSNFRLIAAPFTPMRGDGGLNLPVIQDQARHYLASGVRGAFIGGTSGEGQSLTVEERFALAEAWARDSQRPKLELIVHVGHNAQADAVRLAQHAQTVGADKISLHAPSWFRGTSVGGLIDFCVPVAAAAPALPFYLYDIPKITGVNLSSAAFLAAAKSRIPTLTGIKYTNPDCITVQECIQLNGGTFDVLWGTDETLLAGVVFGASGAVGSTYNFAAPLYLRMIKAAEAQDWTTARDLQAKAIAMVRVLEQFSTLAALKYSMSLVGVDCGPVRSPVANLSPADRERLRDKLESIQFQSEITAIK